MIVQLFSNISFVLTIAAHALTSEQQFKVEASESDDVFAIKAAEGASRAGVFLASSPSGDMFSSLARSVTNGYLSSEAIQWFNEF